MEVENIFGGEEFFNYNESAEITDWTSQSCENSSCNDSMEVDTQIVIKNSLLSEIPTSWKTLKTQISLAKQLKEENPDEEIDEDLWGYVKTFPDPTPSFNSGFDSVAQTPMSSDHAATASSDDPDYLKKCAIDDILAYCMQISGLNDGDYGEYQEQHQTENSVIPNTSEPNEISWLLSYLQDQSYDLHNYQYFTTPEVPPCKEGQNEEEHFTNWYGYRTVAENGIEMDSSSASTKRSRTIFEMDEKDDEEFEQSDSSNNSSDSGNQLKPTPQKKIKTHNSLRDEENATRNKESVQLLPENNFAMVLDYFTDMMAKLSINDSS